MVLCLWLLTVAAVSVKARTKPRGNSVGQELGEWSQREEFCSQEIRKSRRSCFIKGKLLPPRKGIDVKQKAGRVQSSSAVPLMCRPDPSGS